MHVSEPRAGQGTGGSGHWRQRLRSEQLRLVLREKSAEAELTTSLRVGPPGLVSSHQGLLRVAGGR